MGTYLSEAWAAGMALGPDRPGGDSLDLDAFNAEPEGSASDQEPGEELSKNRAVQRRDFILPAGSGEGWA